MFAAYIPAGDLANHAKELPAQLRKNFTGAMALLRKPGFQDLLMDYPRAPRTSKRFASCSIGQKDWGTDALAELRQKLAASPERFDMGNLQKAHELHYKKALVDIISMIKHAAKNGEPVLTAEERVERAFAKVVAGKTFTHDQEQWLGLIKAHLTQNLTIDREDFENLPVFTRRGGLSQATRIFAGALDHLFDQLNEAVAE